MMTEDIGYITDFWEKIRHRLNINMPAPLSLTTIQLHSLLCTLEVDQVHAYKFNSNKEELADIVNYAMNQNVIPASLVEALDEVTPNFNEMTASEWPSSAVTVFGNPEASLESKVSAAELALLYGPEDQRISVLDQLAGALNGEKAEKVPKRTSVALSLVEALTGQYLADSKSGELVEFLNADTQGPAIDLLSRWKLQGKLWKQVLSSGANDERDSLLRKLHDIHPDILYAGVNPQDFISQGLVALEGRVGRPVLLHLALQPKVEAWTQHIANLNMSDTQLPLLNLLLEARPTDHESIVAALDTKLAQVNQNTFEQDLANREDGYAALFELERHGIELTFPDAFFDAAVNVLAKGGVFKPSKIPERQRERILAGVWSKIAAGNVNIPTSLLRNHVELYLQRHYDNGGRKEFTHQVLPRMIRSGNADNLAWAVSFLFARHRRKSTIPDVSDAEIQAAITEVYPQSSGSMKVNIERLASKKWFSLPARSDEESNH